MRSVEHRKARASAQKTLKSSSFFKKLKTREISGTWMVVWHVLVAQLMGSNVAAGPCRDASGPAKKLNALS